MKPFASLCVLAYKRPELLIKCLDSIEATADYPYEIIINFDGIEEISNIMFALMRKYSKCIISKGPNRGVGRSFQNCLGLAEGDYIVKVDSDLTFQPKWLSRAVTCLENNPDVGTVGLFDYHLWDPNDERFKPENNIIEDRGDCLIVKDFVSSIYGFRRNDLPITTAIPDDGFHQKHNKCMALIHSVTNTAFGVGKSTYVSGTMDRPFKTPTTDTPLIIE